MAIPKCQEIMLPLLELASDQQEHQFRSVVDDLVQKFKLTDNELKELLPSGQQAIFDNRVGWARTYLAKAHLLETIGRGKFKITQRGLDFLKTKPTKIDAKILLSFSEFAEFRGKNKDTNLTTEFNGSEMAIDSEITPEESIELGYQKLRHELEQDILQKVKSCSPAFFENLVVELLLKMGYGGSLKDAGKAIGKSGDGGIDGIIKEDRLGLDSVYIQAKRWDNSAVGRPEIQKFAGALQMHHARKGIFITTSKFSSEAKDYVHKIDSRIVLIDGNELAQLMIDYNVGVSQSHVYEVKRTDLDYFSEE